MPQVFDPNTGAIFNVAQDKENEIIVRTASQLSGAIESGKIYFIDGVIDVTSIVPITVPTGGMYLGGHGYGISGLYSTGGNDVMFESEDGSYSGDFIAKEMFFYCTGTGSKLFDLDNDGNFSAFELNSVNLGDFSVVTPNLGDIRGYRQFRIGACASISYGECARYSRG